MSLVDTSVWVEYLRGRVSPEADWVDQRMAENAELCTCGLILTEVLQGVRSPKEYREASDLLAALRYLGMPRRAYLLAVDIYRAAQAKGKTIRSSIDCMIAACAIVNGVRLAQEDIDFEVIASVSELRLVQFPTKPA